MEIVTWYCQKVYSLQSTLYPCCTVCILHLARSLHSAVCSFPLLCSLHYILNLYFTPSPQSAPCSLHFTPVVQSAFYPQSHFTLNLHSTQPLMNISSDDPAWFEPSLFIFYFYIQCLLLWLAHLVYNLVI